MTQAQAIQTNPEAALPLPEGVQGVVADWSSDQRAFKNVPWGKAMMWIFLLSDTFIFSCFLVQILVAICSFNAYPDSTGIDSKPCHP